MVHNYQDSNNFFAQDTWRIKPTLTITYGLRYELFSPMLNHQNALSNFTPANGGGFVTAQDGDWYARGLVHPDKNDFAPRLGFSWQPKEHVVLRGGYGIFYQHVIRIGSESMLAINPPWVIDGSLAQTLGSTTPAFQLKNGFPAAQFTPALVDLTKLQTRAQDPNERSGYVSQVSFGPQIEISQSTVLDISYVGNFGRKMNRLRNANQGYVTGFDATGKPITIFPYANLNTHPELHRRQPRLPGACHQRRQHQLQRPAGLPAPALLQAPLLWHQLHLEPQLLRLRGQPDRRLHARQRL